MIAHSNTYYDPTGSRIASLAELPADTLLHIVARLDVSDILRLRQCSMLFYQLTGQHSVWHHAYHTSPHLLRSLPADATATELERAVIVGERLEKNWSSAYPRVVRSRTLHVNMGPDPPSYARAKLALFRESYLITHVTGFGFTCYDLDAENIESPIAQYEDHSLVYRAVRDHDEASGLLTFLAIDRDSEAARLFIVVMRLDLPPNTVAFHLVAMIETPTPLPTNDSSSYQIAVRQEFVVLNAQSEIYMWNLHNLQLYKPVPPISPPDTHPFCKIKHCFLTDRYLFVNFPNARPPLLDVFPLPLSNTQSSAQLRTPTVPIIIPRSHYSADSYHATELVLTRLDAASYQPNSFPCTVTAIGLDSSASTSTTAILRIEITLHHDGLATVHSSASPAFLSFGYNLLASSNERCVRGVCLKGRMGGEIALINVDSSSSTQRGPSNDSEAKERAVSRLFGDGPVVKHLFKPEQVSFMLGFAFSGAAGRVCATWAEKEKVVILDYV